MTKTLDDVRAIVLDVNLAEELFVGSSFRVEYFAGSQIIFIQHTYLRPDAFSGDLERGYGRKWHVSPWATESEIVLTCLKAAITNAEHEVRESFRYKHSRVAHPHIDVNALAQVSGRVDARPTPATEPERAEVLG